MMQSEDTVKKNGEEDKYKIKATAFTAICRIQAKMS